MRVFEDLPSTNTPINSTNLNEAQTDILDALGITTDNWSSSATYSSGAIVIDDNCLYENTTGTNTTTRPSSDSTNWSLVPLVVNGMINPKLTKTVYSESETKTNKVWIDGKPIYRKEITLTDHPGQTSPFTKALGLSNIGQIWLDTIHSQWVSTSSGQYFQFPYYDGSGYVEGYITLSSGTPTFNLRHNQNIWNIYLVVEYTKTTD